MESNFTNRDIISITDFTREEILYLCEKGMDMHNLEMHGRRNDLSDKLRTRALSSMFYEPSTRTRTSFNTAARELGMQVDGFSGTEGTAVMKKETIRDTVMMMGANHFDVIAMRHPLDGSLQWAADVADIPVINGGDGKNEHPTQSLLDLLTLYRFNDKKLDGLNIGFGGDLSHGRTIKSLSLALSHFKNITIRWAAEDFLGMPKDLEGLLESRGVKVIREESVRDVMKGIDFYYMTRPQLERMQNVTQGEIMEMMKKYRIDLEKVEGFDVKVMHPLPVNSEIAEIDYLVYFSPVQGFFPQAEFGIFARKALLYEMLKHDEYIQFSGKLADDLEFGNNRLKRATREETKKGMFIDKIIRGTVIDHMGKGTAQMIAADLGLEDKGYDSIPAYLSENDKSFLKTNLRELTERELKKIAKISPDPTISYIEDGKVADKFVYLLCKNDNCVTGVVNEDVPSKFYNDEGTIRCRYCRKPYDITNPKVSDKEREGFISLLPKKIEQIRP
ncbi:aspartate carbamoyltransferase [Candidatus Woesearchaeota archaeon]|nr:aspartate carbamoyltransferase [Candidatus Woesearchaeota archaeon]